MLDPRHKHEYFAEETGLMHLKSRLRSRTVYFVEIEEVAPFSYKCRNFVVVDVVELEESAAFLYTCHNFQVV